MKTLATALVVLLVSPTAARAHAGTLAPTEVFRDLSFEEALLEARKTERLVMIDFFTTWCAPCKRLDEVTWTDSAVQAWLAEHTVALKLDAEQEVELAETYRVAAYPTILFVQPDEEERGRIVGFRDASGFLEAADDAVRGIRASDRALEKLRADENSASLRQRYAEALAREGRHAEALEEYLWCFDHGLEHDRSYAGVRVSFLLRSIVQLGASYPPAREALEERRDELGEAAGRGLCSPDEVRDFAALNRVLEEPERTLDLYDRLADIEGLTEARRLELRRGMAHMVVDMLLEKRRYEEVLELTGDVDQALEQARFRQEWHLENGDEDTAAIMKRISVEKLVKNYEALVGSRTRDEEAMAYAERILEFDPTAATRQALAEAAARAGRAEVAEDLPLVNAAEETDAGETDAEDP